MRVCNEKTLIAKAHNVVRAHEGVAQDDKKLKGKLMRGLRILLRHT